MTQEAYDNLIKELCKFPTETEWVEFKKNNCDPDEIGRLVSAISNSVNIHNKESGYIIFGVDDKTHEIVGTTIKTKQLKVGAEEAEQWIMQRLNPKINFQVMETTYEGNRIVIVEIPASRDRPTYFNEISYIKIGSLTKNLIDYPEKERLIWNNPQYRSFEKEFAASGLTEEEVLSRLDYPKFFDLMHIPLPSNRNSIIEQFKEEGLVIRIRGLYCITNLGAVLFAKDMSLFESLRRKTLRVIVYKGKDRINTIEERQGTRGYAIGFKGVVAFINSKLPSNEEIKEALRVERKMYPEIAVRELVANALIHQDFSKRGTGPIIEIFSDRLEISNPGEPLISTSRFIDHPPQSRNEQLASLLRRIGICEERGSGIDKVISSIEVFQLPAPNFENYDNSTKATLYSYKKLSQMDRADKIRACYQHCCLNYVSGKTTTNSTVRKRFEISDKNYSIASRIIADTEDAKLIKSYDPQETGSKKHAKYIPIWAS